MASAAQNTAKPMITPARIAPRPPAESRACQPCSRMKTKCDFTQRPCPACVTRGMEVDCLADADVPRRACAPCRRAKRNCDRQRPCGRCVKLGKQDACQSYVKSADGGTNPTVEPVKVQMARIAEDSASSEVKLSKKRQFSEIASDSKDNIPPPLKAQSLQPPVAQSATMILSQDPLSGTSGMSTGTAVPQMIPAAPLFSISQNTVFATPNLQFFTQDSRTGLMIPLSVPSGHSSGMPFFFANTTTTQTTFPYSMQAPMWSNAITLSSSDGVLETTPVKTSSLN